MIRCALRTTIALGCRASGVLASTERGIRDQLIVLCYHRVLPAERRRLYFNPDVVVTPEAFRRHCLLLKRRFDVRPLSEAVDAWHKRAARTKPLAAITFDDGYRDNYEYAAPILAETGLAATFFVIAGLVGTDQTTWYDRLARAFAKCRATRAIDTQIGELTGLAFSSESSSAHSLVARAKRLAPEDRLRLIECVESAAGGPVKAADDCIMDWTQLAELDRAGNEIGSHTCMHEILTRLDDDRLRFELCESRRKLQERLGRPVRAFCYPNGDMDDRVARATAEAGYDCAVIVDGGTNASGQNPYRLKRWFVSEDRLADVWGAQSETLLRAELCGLAKRIFRR